MHAEATAADSDWQALWRRVPPLLRACIIAFDVSLAIRLAFVVSARGSPFFQHRLIDEQDYDILAKSLLAGRWPGSEALFRPPLYPIFLAAAYRLVGDDVLTARLVGIGFGAVAAPLTVCIAACALGSVRRGLAAGLVVAMCGPLVYFDAQLLAASLDVLLVLATVALVLRANASNRTRDWGIAGAMLGLSAMNRGSMVLVVPVIVLWALTARDAALARSALARRLAAFVAAAAVVMAPLAWHNARNDERPEASYAPEAPAASVRVVSPLATLVRMATGRYCPLGWADGVNLYMGNLPEVVDVNRDSDTGHFPWFEQLNAQPWKHGATTAHEHAAWFKARAREYIVAHPIRWLELMGRKVLDVINGYEMPRGTSAYGERANAPILSLLLWDRPLRFPSGLLIPLGLTGAWVLRRDRRALLIGLVMVTQFVFVVAFFVTSRYRAPALPLATILATGLLAHVFERIRTPMRWTLGLILEVATCAALIVCSNLRLAGQPLGRSAVEEFDLGVELVADGEHNEAMQHFRAAIAISPHYGPPHVFLGILHHAAGDVDAAIREYRIALDFEPDNPIGRNALGTALLAKNDLDGAEREFSAAATSDTRFGEPRFWMGYARLARGDAKGALPWLEEARRLKFGDPRLAPTLEHARQAASSN
jgi:4-amino-4-deoxy-L-arabinose transferase-like glycosyltransferase